MVIEVLYMQSLPHIQSLPKTVFPQDNYSISKKKKKPQPNTHTEHSSYQMIITMFSFTKEYTNMMVSMNRPGAVFETRLWEFIFLNPKFSEEVIQTFGVYDFRPTLLAVPFKDDTTETGFPMEGVWRKQQLDDKMSVRMLIKLSVSF